MPPLPSSRLVPLAFVLRSFSPPSNGNVPSLFAAGDCGGNSHTYNRPTNDTYFCEDIFLLISPRSLFSSILLV